MHVQSNVYTMNERMHALLRFVETSLHGARPALEPASADASFRSYWRLTLDDASTRVVMDAPPAQENIEPWLDIGARLHAAGLHTPDVFAVDRAHGFILMEDLGTRAYLAELNADRVDALYADALDALLRLQSRIDTGGLPVFDAAFIRMELELMPEWFLHRHLGYAISAQERAAIDDAFALLIDTALAQPQGFMHRDYHSRNLMFIETGNAVTSGDVRTNPGIIDFQGALIGPITYDLASLLRDCYIAWEPARVEAWLEGHRRRLQQAQLISGVDAAQFRRWFDLTGLQRHLKVLGIFCRLWLRDGKAQYLDDLPLVWRYVMSVTRSYAELAPLAGILERALDERDIARPRAGNPA